MDPARWNYIKLARQLECEANAALDLWTWLPSHKVAKKHHGDYADEFKPSVEDIMREASTVFGDQYSGTNEAVTLFGTDCPCGESHEFAEGELP